MPDLVRKFLSFLSVSGVGWLIDFGVYTVLTGALLLPVALSNYISSFFAVSFVFAVSTRKTFVCREDGLKLGTKYVIYVVYQLLLVTAVSFLAQWLAGVLSAILPVPEIYAKLAAKVLITPITMIMNFFVLKQITEKW